ncbi:MAG: hypothetical protein ACXWL8_03985, partial [Candidatus Limnocylindria bacterium]
PADILSLVAGLITLAFGLVLLTGRIGDVPMEWVGPAVAIGLGITILVAARGSHAPDQDQPKAASDDK